MTLLRNQAEATEWLQAAFPDVPRETLQRLARFEAYVREQNSHQNLIAKSTLDDLRVRHVADSAQLLLHTRAEGANWLDLGSGAGFPGLIVAALSNCNVTLVESRRLRIEFLTSAVELLGLESRVTVQGSPVERLPARPYSIISARAFAPLERLLALAHRFSTENTVWILPKGRSAQSELEQARDAWQGDFRLEPSITDPEARIIVATGVQPRDKRRKTQ